MSRRPVPNRTMVIRARAERAADVVELVLEPVDGAPLPVWSPGAHIDIAAGALTRQYSLVGNPGESAWRVAFLHEPTGRGGSAWLFANAVPGATMNVGGPRNHFALDASPRYLFVAGGVGITPFLPIIAAVAPTSATWELHYAGRSRQHMAFARDLAAQYPGNVTLYPGDEGTRMDLTSLLADLEPGRRRDGLLLYACGPRRMLAEIEDLTQEWPSGTVRGEHFVPRDVGPPVWDGDFDVDLLLTGATVTVPPERSVLDVVEDFGYAVLSSCREGTCGTCETTVVEGEIDHRDSVLTPTERLNGDVMMICVSRAAGPRLVLEL